MKLEHKNILIVSGEAWGPAWYSKHNYASQLSQKNNVYFLNPPHKFSLLNVFKKNVVEEKINDHLTILQYKNILPVRFNFSRLLNEWFVFKNLNNYFKSKKINDLIFWTFDPIRLSSPEILNPSKIILHAVDHYLFTYPSEEILVRKVDYVICVSDIIAKTYKKYTSKVHVIPHAIPDNVFLPLKKKGSKGITVIYVGTIDDRLDFPYINYITKTFPDITFKFIGKVRPHVKPLFTPNQKNVIFEGEKPSSELKNYIRDSDFCFLFKDYHHPGNSISSHKMLQYFAQGKPIFSTELVQYLNISSLLYMENDMEKMAELIKKFIELGDKEEFIEKRIEYAKQHTFSSILSKIEEILN